LEISRVHSKVSSLRSVPRFCCGWSHLPVLGFWSLNRWIGRFWWQL